MSADVRFSATKWSRLAIGRQFNVWEQISNISNPTITIYLDGDNIYFSHESLLFKNILVPVLVPPKLVLGSQYLF